MTEKHSEYPDLLLLRQKGLFLFSILILGFLGCHFWDKTKKQPLLENELPETRITVELEGKVQRPGLLLYSQTPSVQQVIRDGGGFMADQAISASEGKEMLSQDGALRVAVEKNEKILIQHNPLSAKVLWILGRPIPLNRAAVEDLDRLPGIGPGLAQRIVEYRQARGSFSSLSQLKEVNGIKEKTFEKIKGYFIL
jgi:competence protein ComEA